MVNLGQAELAMNHQHKILLGTVADANPACTNVEQLKRGTSTRSPDQQTETEDSYCWYMNLSSDLPRPSSIGVV